MDQTNHHTISKTVYYHDTDAGGVVYYANYLKYLEEARYELLKQYGWDVRHWHQQGIFFAVRFCRIDYKSPARLGDHLWVETTVEKITAAQIIFQHTIRRAPEGGVCVSAQVGVVCLNNIFKPMAIPEELKQTLPHNL